MFKLIKNLISSSPSFRPNKKNKLVERYIKNGRIPWSAGYIEYKTGYIVKHLKENSLLSSFAKNNRLPDSYGVGLDERVIEYPWVFSRLSDSMVNILDAGSTLNHSPILDCEILHHRHMHILTLAPEKQCYWKRGISYLYHDMCDNPVRDSFYDAVIAISSLEHVGFDNALFGHANTENSVDSKRYLTAIRECLRVLKTGGDLFITLPFGKKMIFENMQQFDCNEINALLAAVEYKHVELGYFKYSQSGWQVSTDTECADAEYYPLCMLDDAAKSQLARSSDNAAAARALVCIHLVK